MTLDQRRSRQHPDAVESLLDVFNAAGSGLVRSFERTVGDEIQGLAKDADLVVALLTEAARRRNWWIGIGVGPVDEPTPGTVRAARGPALVAARDAVEKAKSAPTRLAVRAGRRDDAASVARAEAALRAWVMVLDRRTPEGWEAIDQMTKSATQKDAAAVLGISAQSLNTRLRRAGWHDQQAICELCGWLLDGCESDR
jgi:hypothetical protein